MQSIDTLFEHSFRHFFEACDVRACDEVITESEFFGQLAVSVKEYGVSS